MFRLLSQRWVTELFLTTFITTTTVTRDAISRCCRGLGHITRTLVISVQSQTFHLVQHIVNRGLLKEFDDLSESVKVLSLCGLITHIVVTNSDNRGFRIHRETSANYDDNML